MTSLFKPATGGGTAAISTANKAEAARLAAEKQDVQQREARGQAAGRRARGGLTGFRSLLSSGFGGVKGDKETLG